jgi:hypothetical protein
VDAAHTGAPAHRERVVILFTRADRPLPDPVVRVDGFCRKHGTVRAVQQWTGSRRYWIGTYGRDYHWACPTCDTACQPASGRAADAIDLTRPAPTMLQRANGEGRRITDETIARIGPASNSTAWSRCGCRPPARSARPGRSAPRYRR